MRWSRGGRSVRIGVVWLALVCALAAPVRAQEPAPADRWHWARFAVHSGLPSDLVIDVADAANGTLWAMTGAGPAWFDGFQWHAVPFGTRTQARVAALAAGTADQLLIVADGKLWVATPAGVVLVDVPLGADDFVTAAANAPDRVLVASKRGALFEWTGSVLTPHSEAEAIGPVTGLYPAGPSRAWVSTARGVFSREKGRWRLRARAPAAEPYVFDAVVEDGFGESWASVARPIAARGLLHWRSANDTQPEAQALSSVVVSMAPGDRGELYAVHSYGEVTRLRNGQASPFALRVAGLADAHRIGVRANGDVWVATDHGLFLSRRSTNHWSFFAFPGADGRNAVNDFHRSQDALWMATANGLVKLNRDLSFEHIQRVGDEPIGSVTGVRRDQQDRLWISSGHGFTGVRWLDEKGWHRLTADATLDRCFVHRIALDREGGVWFLALDDKAIPGQPPPTQAPGAFRLAPDGTVTRWNASEGSMRARVYAFAQGPDGAYWFGTDHGLSRWHSGQWQHWTTVDGLASPKVFTVAVDDAGTAWFGHETGGGLGRFAEGRVRYYTAEDGLASNAVWTVVAGPPARIWVACRGGLSLFENGMWTKFDETSGLRSTRVWPLLASPGQIYVGTNGGGLAMLDLSESGHPPRVLTAAPVVEDATAQLSWRAYAWWGEMSDADVLTRIQLDDGPWLAWTAERTRTLSSLSAGNHVIRVQARGLLGQVGPPTDIPLHVPRPLYERPAFLAPAGILLLAVVIQFVVLRRRRLRHADELRRREQRFRRFFNASPMVAAISSVDQERFLDVNDAFLKFFDCRREDLIGRTAKEAGILMPREDRTRLMTALADPVAPHWIETTATLRSGGKRNLMFYAELVELDSGPVMVTQALDVTDQRKLESQVRQVNRLESVGRLAGAVAHDFNNLLTVIVGNAEVVASRQADAGETSMEMDQISQAADRASGLVRQLLAFARKQVSTPLVINLSDVVLKTDGMLRRLIGDEIELVTLLPPRLPTVYIDPAQLEQVLMNMAVNARDAMAGGGTLTIRATEIELREHDSERDHDTVPGKFVRLSITDTGSGMDEHTAAQVFDPFFTTKETGTGLGLATCYGIVKQAGGQITIATAPGRGTSFNVDLPVSTTRANQLPDAPAAPAKAPTGRETVLLTEDETQVRRLAATVLRQWGYRVIEAADGLEALELEQAEPETIHLLLTDVMMPNMRGTELARRMRDRRPAMSVLFMSGYVDENAFADRAIDGSVAFLAKPFSPAALATAVRAVLDGPPQSTTN